MSMMVGCDVVNIARVRNLLERWQWTFIARILSPLEREILINKSNQQRAAFVAKRFAAKEAIGKALGSGVGLQFAFADISVLNDARGAPYVDAPNLPYDFKVSLADDEPVAIAFVIAVRKKSAWELA